MENVSPVTPTAPAPVPTTNGQDPAPASVKPSTPRRAAKKAATGKKAAKFTDGQKIKLLVKSNPKRPTGASYARFALYRTGMTVKTAIKKGVRRADLIWDVGHEFISIK